MSQASSSRGDNGATTIRGYAQFWNLIVFICLYLTCDPAPTGCLILLATPKFSYMPESRKRKQSPELASL